MKNASTIVTVHMVSSVNGFVTSGDDSQLDWMKSIYAYAAGKELTQQDVQDYLDSIDCYVLGAKSYALTQQIGWPYGEKPVYVLSTSIDHVNRASVTLYRGTPSALVADAQRSSYQNIWVVGGPKIVRSFLHEQLADRLIITIAPTVLASGRPFFEDIDKTINLELTDHQAYADGMVELSYDIHY